MAEYAQTSLPFQSLENAFNDAVEKMKDINERGGFLDKERTEREGWYRIGYFHLSKEEMDIAIEKAKILLGKLVNIKKSEDYLTIPDNLLTLQ
jgi:hypothetical protein